MFGFTQYGANFAVGAMLAVATITVIVVTRKRKAKVPEKKQSIWSALEVEVVSEQMLHPSKNYLPRHRIKVRQNGIEVQAAIFVNGCPELKKGDRIIISLEKTGSKNSFEVWHFERMVTEEEKTSTEGVT